MIYKMDLKDSSDTMTFNLLETPIVDKDIEGAVDNVTLDGNQYTDYLYLKKQYIQKWAIMCPDEYDELRGFYTRQFEEGEVPSYRVYYGANVTRDYTLNGDYFQFNAEGIETGMTLSQLLGNAEQTTYSGKNLLPPTADWTQTVSGVTITCSNGQYTFSGTATANGSTTARATIAPYTIQSGDYFHYGNTLVSDQINIQYLFTDNTYFATSMNAANRVVSLASYVGKTISACRVNFASGSAFNGVAKPMILHNVSTVADYEPYVGGIPAPNPSYPQPISTVTGEQNVEVVGKNLFDKQTLGLGKNWDGSVGTICYPYQSQSTRAVGLIPVQPNTTYTLQLLESEWYAMQILEADGSYTVTRNITITQGNTLTITFTTGNQANYVGVKFKYGSAGTTVMTLDLLDSLRLQLELGSTATAYEPYQGQSYEVNLEKNLLDINSLVKGGVTVSDGVATGQGQHFYAVFGQNTNGVSFIKRGGQLSISLKAYTDGNQAIEANDGLVVRVIYTDGTSAIVIRFLNNQTTATTKTYTTAAGKDVANIQLTYANDGGNIWHISEFQIEQGAQPTSYAPYFTPIELAKIGTYQDRIYKSDGKWYIEKQVGKVVFDGTEDGWLSEGGGAPYRMAMPDFFRPSPSSILAICDHFESVPYNSNWNNYTSLITTNATGSATAFKFRYTAITSLADWKTWLSTHPTTVYYALATPTTTEITDETLRAQLNFLASLYGGENNISLVGTGAQGEMEVFIRDVMSVETDVVPEVPVRLTLTDDGVINACGCRRNVQLTMRETTE